MPARLSPALRPPNAKHSPGMLLDAIPNESMITQLVTSRYTTYLFCYLATKKDTKRYIRWISYQRHLLKKATKSQATNSKPPIVQLVTFSEYNFGVQILVASFCLWVGG